MLVATREMVLVAVTDLVDVGVTVTVVDLGTSMQVQILPAAALAVDMKAVHAAEAGLIAGLPLPFPLLLGELLPPPKPYPGP